MSRFDVLATLQAPPAIAAKIAARRHIGSSTRGLFWDRAPRPALGEWPVFQHLLQTLPAFAAKRATQIGATQPPPLPRLAPRFLRAFSAPLALAWLMYVL